MARALTSVLRRFVRFRRARDGSAAVEFALLALPFFLLTFGMAEVAMIGLMQTSLNFAVSETARSIRTGQSQMAGASATQIKQQLCSELGSLLTVDCNANLFLDVDTFASFVAAQNDNANPVQNGQFNQSGMAYNPGQPSSIVVVRAYYRWQVMTPFFQSVFANVSGGQRVMSSTMMFRNEPYQTGP